MKFGISDSHWHDLEQMLLAKIRSQKLKVYIFGSRAKGKYHPFSDIDLLVDDANQVMNLSVINDALEEIENSNFPYKIDLVYSTELASSYREDVEKTKILLS